jgi:dTDP-glucose pyrophosphorylase
MLILNGDELFLNSTHLNLVQPLQRRAIDGVVGYLRVSNRERIRQGYGMEVGSDSLVSRLLEKPHTPWNNLLGVGTWLLTTDFFRYYNQTPINPERRERDLVGVIQTMIDDGKRFCGYELGGEFININTPTDKLHAELILAKMLAVPSDIPAHIDP